MAHAKTTRSEVRVTLDLSGEEAAALFILTGSVGGADTNKFCRLTSAVYHALHHAGFGDTSHHCVVHPPFPGALVKDSEVEWVADI